jgi:hypothetical protein
MPSHLDFLIRVTDIQMMKKLDDVVVAQAQPANDQLFLNHL